MVSSQMMMRDMLRQATSRVAGITLHMIKNVAVHIYNFERDEFAQEDLNAFAVKVGPLVMSTSLPLTHKLKAERPQAPSVEEIVTSLGIKFSLGPGEDEVPRRPGKGPQLHAAPPAPGDDASDISADDGGADSLPSLSEKASEVSGEEDNAMDKEGEEEVPTAPPAPDPPLPVGRLGFSSLERAATGRAKCLGCGGFVILGTWRWGLRLKLNAPYQVFYHDACVDRTVLDSPMYKASMAFLTRELGAHADAEPERELVLRAMLSKLEGSISSSSGASAAASRTGSSS